MSMPMPMNGPLLELRGVGKSYVDPARPLDEDAVLRGVDLELGAGETLAVLGPSGCGKSTLLNIIGTLEARDCGTLLWEGEDLAGRGEAELAEFRNRSIGFVFQHHFLLPQCTALENVLLPTLVRPPAERADSEARARELLERVGLAQRVEHRPGELSGGERQRVAVVRALIHRPRLLLADEPTGALDGASAEGLADLLVELNQTQGVALCVVTHALPLAERMQRRVRLEAGRLVELAATGHVG